MARAIVTPGVIAAVIGGMSVVASCGSTALPIDARPVPGTRASVVDPAPSAGRLPDAPRTAASATTAARAEAPTSVEPAASAEPGERAPPPHGASRFPPHAFDPPFARTASEGDGRWTGLADGARGGVPVMARALVHPHPIKGFVFVDVIAIDLAKTELRLVAGTVEPESKGASADVRTGLVPSEDWSRLLAVFNGGFMARHGEYGMMLNGTVFVPPRADACTVLLARDGKIAIRSAARELEDAPQHLGWRQTPPCLVERGEVNPRLAQENASRIWGAAVGGARDIRRSALGLDASGSTLFYGFGEWVTARDLALAMRQAGAVAAAELDINWSYTKFFFFTHEDAEPPRIRETIVPKLEYDAKRYTSRPAERDFFYVRAR